MYNVHHKYDLLIHLYVHEEIKVFALVCSKIERQFTKFLPPKFKRLIRVLEILSKSERPSTYQIHEN